MKYQLLLKDILKQTERSQESVLSLHKAMDVMHTVPKAANNMMEVGRLHKFDVSKVWRIADWIDSFCFVINLKKRQ